MSARVLPSFNGRAVPRERVPRLSWEEFSATVGASPARGTRVSALFGAQGPEGVELIAVLAVDEEARLELCSTLLRGDAFPSLTPQCPELHLFERELAEEWGLLPEGHPWLKPVRFAAGARRGADPFGQEKAPAKIGIAPYYKVHGDEVHEVAVGPVHAGVIEPGHFRFQCHGETVFHLEISLGYQHRGVEKALARGPDGRALRLAEVIAGDTTIGHATAYCQVLEGLAGASVPPRAQAIRAVALELERLANHVGDLGALAGDVGFLPTMSYCGRLRGDFLNLTAELCGSRFGRGLLRPGGVASDVEPARLERMLQKLEAAERDVASSVDLLWTTASVQARFEDTGQVTAEVARRIGLVGPAARASGVSRDVRHDQPSGMYRFAQVPVQVLGSGDVYARAYVRWLEIQRSILFVRDVLKTLPRGAIWQEPKAPEPNRVCVALAEGWRGEICHVGITGADGRFASYKVVDPSFHNWMGLQMALRGQQISDFPLCNKSFNLSYCGHDL